MPGNSSLLLLSHLILIYFRKDVKLLFVLAVNDGEIWSPHWAVGYNKVKRNKISHTHTHAHTHTRTQIVYSPDPYQRFNTTVVIFISYILQRTCCNCYNTMIDDHRAAHLSRLSSANHRAAHVCLQPITEQHPCPSYTGSCYIY